MVGFCKLRNVVVPLATKDFLVNPAHLIIIVTLRTGQGVPLAHALHALVVGMQKGVDLRVGDLFAFADRGTQGHLVRQEVTNG